MNLETFIEKFDLFADCPNAVQKMRELILELAVQGKLVEQESASDTCSGSGYQSEKPFLIPESWEWTTLNRLGDTKPRNSINDDVACSFVPMTLIPAEFGWDVRSETKLWAEVKKGYTHFQEGDVVLAKITPCFENGKSAVMQGLIGGIGAGTTELHVFRPGNENLFPRYVLVYLKTRGFIERGRPRMTGSAGQKRIPHDYFANSPFPLPPLAEQKRIVAKVDELMALCDALEAQQKERETKGAQLAKASLAAFADAPSPTSLELLFNPSFSIDPADLRKSILTLAVQGKLVPQESGVGWISDDFDGIDALLAESREESVPNGWGVYRYRDLTILVTSGSRGWKDYYAEDGAIFIRTQNINTDHLILDDVAFVSLPSKAEGMRTQVKKDDILITITGANVTKAARVESELPEAYISQHIALTRPRWSSMSPWLHLCFLSPGSARGDLEKLAYGDKPGLNLGNIRELQISVPPLAEQNRIVAKVDELMALVDRLEAKIAASRYTASRLLEAMVAELSGKAAV